MALQQWCQHHRQSQAQLCEYVSDLNRIALTSQQRIIDAHPNSKYVILYILLFTSQVLSIHLLKIFGSMFCDIAAVQRSLDVMTCYS